MARPDKATITDQTSSGLQFQWLLDGYSSKGARDANQEIMQALVSWENSTAFLRDVVGYTQWDGSSSILQRVPPLQCPLRPGLFCESYTQVKMGAYETRDSFYDEFSYCFVQDWIIYQLTFTRPLYRVAHDDTLTNSYGGKEQNRYCTFTRSYQPRERRKSGFAFEYQKAPVPPKTEGEWATVPDESAFIPDYQLIFLLGWHQVPVKAIPELAIADQLLTVNNAPFVFSTFGGTKVWGAGELLFRGPQANMSAYQGADGEWYEDLHYQFAYQMGGWNSWLRPDLKDGQRDYGPIRRRKAGGAEGSGDPPYPSSDFDRLFRPGNT